MDKLQEIKQSLAKMEQKYTEIKGDMNGDDKMEKMMEYFYDSMSRIRDYMYNIEGQMYKQMDEHKKGHLPPILGAGKMQNALEVLGCDDDYEIAKPTIYVRASRQGNKEFEVDLNIVSNQ